MSAQAALNWLKSERGRSPFGASCVRGGSPVEQRVRGDLAPEGPQLRNPFGGFIPRYDGRVDGADRDACDPVWMDIGLGESLVDSGLIGSERAATLQHQGNAFEWETPFCCSEVLLGLNIHGDAVPSHVKAIGLRGSSPSGAGRVGRLNFNLHIYVKSTIWSI